MSETAPLMVGVSGLRGIVGKSLTPEVAARYAGAVGAFASDWIEGKAAPREVIGRDGFSRRGRLVAGIQDERREENSLNWRGPCKRQLGPAACFAHACGGTDYLILSL